MVSSEPKPQRAATRFRQVLLEHLASRLDSDPFDGARRRHAGRPAIMANEAALAHRGSIGERGDRQIASKIIGEPGMEALEAGIAVLQGERRAEWRLADWTFEEDDELAGDR